MTSRLFRWRTSELAKRAGTDLVSLYVAPSDDLDTAAGLVDDAKTYTDDGGPAERALEALEERPDVGENGLALFADATDVVAFDEELVPPVNNTEVVIDNAFDLSGLTVQRRFEFPVGLVVIERGDALIGELREKKVQRLKRKTGYVPSQHSAGGQSQQRFENRIEGQKKAFFDRVVDRMEQDFLDEHGSPIIEYLVLGGASETVREFTETLPQSLSDCLVSVRSIDVDDSVSVETLHDLYADSTDAIVEAEREEERDAVEAYKAAVGSGSQPTVSTASGVEEALTYHAVDTLLCSATADYDALRLAKSRVNEQGGDFVLVQTDWEGGMWLTGHADECGAILRYEVS